MNKQFIPYKQALELKELGFNEGCFGLYAPPCKTVFLHHYGLLSAKEQHLAPLYQQAFRWFREKYDVVGIVKFGTNEFTFNIFNSDGVGLLTKESLTFNGTYEEAELACLNKLIEIVKLK